PDLRQSLHCLLTPDAVGILISRADIAAIGHALGLPAPIDERERMLLRLFGFAGQYGMLPALIGALGELLRAADKRYAELVAAHPVWDSYGQAWRGRVAAGLALLDEVANHFGVLRLQTRTVGGTAK